MYSEPTRRNPKKDDVGSSKDVSPGWILNFGGCTSRKFPYKFRLGDKQMAMDGLMSMGRGGFPHELDETEKLEVLILVGSQAITNHPFNGFLSLLAVRSI